MNGEPDWATYDCTPDMRLAVALIDSAFARARLVHDAGIEVHSVDLGLKGRESSGQGSNDLPEPDLALHVGESIKQGSRKSQLWRKFSRQAGKFRKHGSPSVVDASRVAAGPGRESGPNAALIGDSP